MSDSQRAPDDLLAADNAAQRLGVVIHQTHSDRVEVGLTVTDQMLNFGGTCHGGVLFHLADIAMSLVSNQDQQPAVATAASIDYLSPAFQGDDVRATVSNITANAGGRNSIHDGTLSVDGRVVALFRGKTLQIRGPSGD